MPSAPSGTSFTSVSVAGAWRQKDLGTAKRFVSWSRQTYGNVGEASWTVVGSNDQNTWYIVDRQTGRNTTTRTETGTVNPSYSQYSYRYYRWITEAAASAWAYTMSHIFHLRDENGAFLSTDGAFTGSTGAGDEISYDSSTVFSFSGDISWLHSSNYNTTGVYSGPTRTIAYDPTSPSGPPVTSPSAPTSLEAVAAGELGVSVSFTPGADGGSAITNYEYSINNGSSYTAFSPSDTSSPVVISGLAYGQSYTIKLRAVNSVGTGAASSSLAYTVPEKIIAYVNTGAQFSKAGIVVSYTDDTGAAATQNVTFANKTLSMDSGLNVSAGNAYLAGAAQIHGAAKMDSTLDVTGAGRFRNALIVDGTFNMGGALNVAGATTMGSTLAVTGATNLNNTLAVAGAASMASSLAVTGASNLNNTLAVAGAASMNSTLAVAGAASMASSMDVTGAARLRNTVQVDGAATMGSSLAVTGASNLNGVLAVAGASNLNNTLAVSGAASLNSTLAVSDAASLASSLAVTGAANLNNTLAVAGAASLNSSLAVAGASVLTGALDVKAASHLENTLLVDGAASLGAALTVAGAATMNNGMTVNGTSTHNGALVVSGAASVGGALAAMGATTLNSSLNAKGASRLEDVLVVDGAASLGNSLAVAGNSALAGSLAVTGASVLTGALNVKAASHLENTLLVGGAASLGNSLTVTGASALNNTLAVAGAASLASTLAVTGAATMASSLDVAGAANVVGAMDVTGASRLRNSAQIDGAASLGSTLAVTGAANLSNSLAVAGATSMASTLDVTGASHLHNNMVVDGAASLNNSLAVTGAASMASTLAVTGAANLNNTLAVTGAASLNNSLAVAGAASMASTLAVTGAANLNNTLAVTGAANLNNTLAVTGAASLNSSLAVTGAASMSNTLAVAGAATFQNNVTVNGNLTVLGSQTAIDTTSLQVKDNAILLADGNEADVLQTGIQLQYKPSGAAAVKYAGVKRQPTTGEFVFFKDSVKTIDDPSVVAAPVSSINLPFENSFVDAKSNASLSSVGSIAYVSGAAGGYAANFVNTAGTNASNYIKGSCSLPNSFSMTMKFKINSLPVFPDRISSRILELNSATANGVFYVEYIDIEGAEYDGFYVGYKNAGGTQATIGKFVGMNINQWYELQVSFNNSGTNVVYLDGTQLGSIASGGLQGLPTTMSVGATYSGGFAFNGCIDNISFYNSILPAPTVSSYTLEWQANPNNTNVFPMTNRTTPSSGIIASGQVQSYSLPAGSYSYSGTSRNISNDYLTITIINASNNAVLSTFSTGTNPWSNGPTVTGTFILAAATNISARFSNGYYMDDSRVTLTVQGMVAAPAPAADIYATVMADSFNSASDARLKKNIVPLEGALDKIDAIRGVQYHWIDGEQSESRQVGVIAQEIQEVYPELVMEGGNGYLSVDYPKLTAVLIESIKELKAMAIALMNK